MVSKLALLSNLLLVSATLAVPSSYLGDRLASRREGRQSQPLKLVEASSDPVSDVVYSSNWAGAALDEDPGTFTSATGTFTIPVISGNGAASAWVGIDGYTCPSAILQAGIFLMISNGQISYSSWYEWFPDYLHDFPGISLGAGDIIQITVTAYSPNSGIVVIENISTGQAIQQQLSSSSALCGQNAEWIVEYLETNYFVPLADFGTITFTNASASGPRGTYAASSGTLLDITENGQALTSVSTNRESVTISYV